MAEPLFTEYRRDLVGRTFFDLLKIAVAAAFASKFFFDFPLRLKIVLWLVLLTLGLCGFFFAPRHPPRRRDA